MTNPTPRSYRDYLTDRRDPLNGKPVFPLAFPDRPVVDKRGVGL